MQINQLSITPKPPSLHWAIVLLLTIVTFGLFGFFWMFLQARFIRKIDPSNRAVFQVLLSAVLFLFQILLSAVVTITIARGGLGTDLSAVMNMLRMFQFLMIITAFWQMRATLMRQYGIQLNGIMTVLFNVYYLQYHLSKLGALQSARPVRTVMPASQTESARS